ncbi:MAG: preprotein translocase subunit SecY [Candidatus Pacebacteria bacterium]|nr:preprotein translocase subunit SecY [Candidatus Paceibacterota bacterium]
MAKILDIFKEKDLRNKVLFILGIFVFFRLMANITIPGIDVAKVNFMMENQYFGMLNLFTGGALDKFSLVMLGLGPYITATIIFQLFTLIFPKMEKLYKEEGEQGRQKFNQYCRVTTPFLAGFQGWGMLMFLKAQGVIGAMDIWTTISAVLCIMAGSVIMMWLGELITEKGIGNGVSLLIFAGIVSDFPVNIASMVSSFDQSQLFPYALFFIASLIIIYTVVHINEARRNIPISYARRVREGKFISGGSTHLPLNINPAGVIPVIFAISILMIPNMLATFFKWSAVTTFMNNPWFYGIAYFILVFLFTFFYTAITFDPKTISTNLQKSGGFIPGIRPGESTIKYIQSVLNKVLVIGATSLGLIAIMPSIIQGLTSVNQFQFLVGGTSLLIVVSVVLETMRQINAQLEMREYDI